MPDADASDETVALPIPDRVSTRTRALAAAVVVALVAALIGAFLWFAADSAADKQFLVSRDGLSAALDTLAAADDTAAVREVAAETAPIAGQTDEFLEADPSGFEHAGLVDVAAALAGIAELDSMAGDNPEAWEQSESAIRDLADSSDEAVAELAPAAERAADRVDEVLADAIDTYEDWVGENARAVEERDAAIASASTYRAQVSGLLDEYATLRQQLSDYITEVETYGSTVEEGYRQFAAASQARRSIRDSLSSLTPPADAASEHARLVSILGDAIAGVEAAERGLDERECTIYGCNVLDQPSFLHFRSESSRISSAFGDAMSDWDTASQRAIDEARAIELPGKPEV